MLTNLRKINATTKANKYDEATLSGSLAFRKTNGHPNSSLYTLDPHLSKSI